MTPKSSPHTARSVKKLPPPVMSASLPNQPTPITRMIFGHTAWPSTPPNQSSPAQSATQNKSTTATTQAHSSHQDPSLNHAHSKDLEPVTSKPSRNLPGILIHPPFIRSYGACPTDSFSSGSLTVRPLLLVRQTDLTQRFVVHAYQAAAIAAFSGGVGWPAQPLHS